MDVLIIIVVLVVDDVITFTVVINITFADSVQQLFSKSVNDLCTTRSPVVVKCHGQVTVQGHRRKTRQS